MHLYRQIYISKRVLHIAKEIIRKEQFETYRKRVERKFSIKLPLPECSTDMPICNNSLHVHKELKRNLSFEILQ